MGTATSFRFFTLCALCASVLVLFFDAQTAQGQVDLKLEPVTGQAATAAYRDLVLSVANHAKEPVRAVSIRMIEGGPAFLFPLAVPSEANAAMTVSLPVSAPEQVYVVRALAGEDVHAAALVAATLATTWPTDRISPVDFVDPQAYARYEEKAASWPGGFLSEMFIAATVACIALSAAVFIRRRAWRLAAVGVVAAACAAGILVWAQRGAPLVQTTVEAPQATEANRPAEATLVVSCLRTTQWQHPSTRLIPIYASPERMARDDAVILPRQGISLTLHAGETRVFRVEE
jgi:hypothetical protein